MRLGGLADGALYKIFEIRVYAISFWILFLVWYLS